MQEDETDLESRSYTRLYREESVIAFSAIDCVLNGTKGVYASSELTSGNRAYARLLDNRLSGVDELNESQRSGLLQMNMQEAAAFALRVRAHLGRETLVITPAPFSAPGWTQAEYLAFWKTLIRTRVSSVYFNMDWQYSNGCAFEFIVATQAGIPTFDSDFHPLSLSKGIERIKQAIADVEERGFIPARLRATLEQSAR